MIGSLNPPKLTGLSHAGAPFGFEPTAPELPQCHHTYCVSSSAPGWLRQSVASNWRPMAMLIRVLWSATEFNCTLMPAFCCTICCTSTASWVVDGSAVWSSVNVRSLPGLLLVLRRGRLRLGRVERGRPASGRLPSTPGANGPDAFCRMPPLRSLLYVSRSTAYANACRADEVVERRLGGVQHHVAELGELVGFRVLQLAGLDVLADLRRPAARRRCGSSGSRRPRATTSAWRRPPAGRT